MKTDSRFHFLQILVFSVSFPPSEYKELLRLAEKNKVSVAWVVRTAVSRFVSSSSPLFA